MVVAFLSFLYCNQQKNMGQNFIYVTQEGYDKMAEELAFLKSKERPRISKAIGEARDKGDLSENAEYDAAKEAQGLLEMKIAKLEADLGNARVLDATTVDTSKAQILTSVKVKNLKVNKEFVYQLVSENEADLKSGRISVKSPIGKGILGKSVGDKVMINVPAGKIELEILDIFVS